MPLVGPPIRGEFRLVAVDDVAASAPADDDARLLAAFEAGESGAGGRLYDRLVPVVDATIARILGGRESDHADLVQSAFEQIVRTLIKQRYAGRCSLAGWAATISCHVGLNALRSRRRERGVIDRRKREETSASPSDVVDLAPAAPLEAQLGARDELAAVRLHLSRMAPERVTTLLLHAMGHDLAEIAELTRTSVAAAQSRLSRARRELHERLGAGATPDRTDFAARLK
jgi:RNA polymerase sigma-70 factor (ECF subfamily)